jgi:hypothetical protein
VDVSALASERRSEWAAYLAQFNFHVARFAHPSWHPDIPVHGRVDSRVEAQLSAWLLQELGLQDEFDWQLSEPQRRIWLLDTAALMRLSEEIALAMHRDWLVPIIDGARVRALLPKVDSSLLRFIIKEVPRGAFHYNAPLVNLEQDAPQEITPKLQEAGARTLVGLLQPAWRAVRGRAQLRFERTWGLDEVPPLPGEHCSRALELICGRLIPRRYPEWAWLF